MDEQATPSDIYNVSRGQIQHYDMSVNQRMIWLANSQAFMFGVYSVTVIGAAPIPFLSAKQQLLGTLIPIVGLLISFFTICDIIAGYVTMQKITNNYKKSTDGLEHESHFPMLYGTVLNRILQRVSPVMISFIFLFVWLYLIMYDHKLL